MENVFSLQDEVEMKSSKSEGYIDASPESLLNYEKYLEYKQKWIDMSTEEKSKYNKSMKKYFSTISELGNDDDSKVKNYYKYLEEVKTRINSPVELTPIKIGNNSKMELLELIESLENEEIIDEIYKTRKKCVQGSGLNSHEKQKLIYCIKQGKELFHAGLNGTLMVKPLNYFYSISSFAYLAIILNNPMRFSLDSLPGSHGIDPMIKNEIKKTRFGSGISTGTFSEIVNSFPTTRLIKSREVNFELNNMNTILNYFNYDVTISLGTLFSMIPSISEYYKEVTGVESRCYPIDLTSSPQSYKFAIGDGVRKPDKNKLAVEFKDCKIDEFYGKYIVEVKLTKINDISPFIYTDESGNMWYIENPIYPIILNEFTLNYLIIYLLSNVMRYSPFEWGALITNDVDSKKLLLLRRYLTNFESYYFYMILRHASHYYPILNRDF